MQEIATKEVIAVSHAWDRAMIENDPEAIGQFMADDWTMIGPDGKVTDKAIFLGLVQSGALTHDEMSTDEVNVRVYGNTAVTMARGISGGKFKGYAFREVERVSCVFVKQNSKWRCVLTHLSRMEAK